MKSDMFKTKKMSLDLSKSKNKLKNSLLKDDLNNIIQENILTPKFWKEYNEINNEYNIKLINSIKKRVEKIEKIPIKNTVNNKLKNELHNVIDNLFKKPKKSYKKKLSLNDDKYNNMKKEYNLNNLKKNFITKLKKNDKIKTNKKAKKSICKEDILSIGKSNITFNISSNRSKKNKEVLNSLDYSKSIKSGLLTVKMSNRLNESNESSIGKFMNENYKIKDILIKEFEFN